MAVDTNISIYNISYPFYIEAVIVSNSNVSQLMHDGSISRNSIDIIP